MKIRSKHKISPFMSKLLMTFSVVIYGIFLCSFVSVAECAEITLTPEKIKFVLLNGSDSQLTNLSSDLHLIISKYNVVGALKDVACTEFDSVDIIHANLRKPYSQAILKIYSSSCQYTYLVILEQAKLHTWRFIQTISLWSKDRIPRITFEKLVNSNESEIVAQDYETDYGTGILQTDMTIWKLCQNGLQVIFDEPMHVAFSISKGKNGMENTDQNENSVFTFVDGELELADRVSDRQILQQQVILDHQAKIVRWWKYSWVPESGRFQKHPTWLSQ